MTMGRDYTNVSIGWRKRDGSYFISVAAMREGEDEWDEYILTYPFPTLDEAKQKIDKLADQIVKDGYMVRVPLA